MHPQFDRRQLAIQPLSARQSKAAIEDIQIAPDAVPRPLPAQYREIFAETVTRIRSARAAGKPVMLDEKIL